MNMFTFFFYYEILKFKNKLVDMIQKVPSGFPDSPSLTAHMVHNRLVPNENIYVQNCQITMFVLIMVFICLVPSLSKVLKTALCTL